MNDLDAEWENYLKGGSNVVSVPTLVGVHKPSPLMESPKCSELYVSTKTKVLFLNHQVDMEKVFWEIPITEYWKAAECVIKKQMKIVSKSREEFESYQSKLKELSYYTEHVIKQIDNPTARRIKFKDERKITIGISKKDIMNCRSKQKSAFYNCFTMIMRFQLENSEFREIHVKVFNTGKLEIPGILNNYFLEKVKIMILRYLTPHIADDLDFVECNQNVLINSNFTCNYRVDRENLMKILRQEYNIETSYDQSTYPGLKCKFYFHNATGYPNDDVEHATTLHHDLRQQERSLQKGFILPEDVHEKIDDLVNSGKYTAISFMVFQTGSGLIVGKCDDTMLNYVYEFVKNILEKEYPRVVDPFGRPESETTIKMKKTKIRKRVIYCHTHHPIQPVVDKI